MHTYGGTDSQDEEEKENNNKQSQKWLEPSVSYRNNANARIHDNATDGGDDDHDDVNDDDDNEKSNAKWTNKRTK